MKSLGLFMRNTATLFSDGGAAAFDILKARIFGRELTTYDNRIEFEVFN